MEFIESTSVIAGIVVCGALLFYMVFASWPKERDETADPHLWTLVVVAPTIFAATWLWLSLALPLIAWGFWIGDNEHWFYDAARGVAALAAVVSTTLFCARVLLRTVRPRYVRVQTWGAVILLLLGATYVTADTLKQALGFRPEAAAQRVVQRGYPYDVSELKQVLKEVRGNCHTYLFRNDREPKMQVTVCRYRWILWRGGGSQLFVPHPNVWDSIERFRNARPDLARRQLEGVMKQYPDSEASERAERELSKMRE